MPPNDADKVEQFTQVEINTNVIQTIGTDKEYDNSRVWTTKDNDTCTAKPIQYQTKIKSRTANGKFQTPFHVVLFGYIFYLVVFAVSWARELFYGTGPYRGINRKRFKEKFREEYVPLYSSFESFWARYGYRRLSNVFGNTIASVAGARIKVVKRVSDDDNWSFTLRPDSIKECINLASYNYLGYTENNGFCAEKAISGIKENGISHCSRNQELGLSSIQRSLEKTVAKFLSVEDSITIGSGFATNALSIPCLVSKGCLVISDEYNHASTILGLRLSGATVKQFKHNDTESLENILRSSIIKGQPRTNRPWKKILIVVEGIYSMEGSICPLKEIIEIKKRYNAYLYVDEAHSVGAMGPNGRGIVEYLSLDPSDVDLMMGTFSKNFGAAGGYIAGSKEMINFLRIHSHAKCYSSPMSPPVANQIISSMECIMKKEMGGMERIQQLSKNATYFRKRLEQMGFVVVGDNMSPVIPIMMYNAAKFHAFVLECLKRGVATVGVGFPATKLMEERVRFCISASHDKKMLDEALGVIDIVGEFVNCKYNRKIQTVH